MISKNMGIVYVEDDSDSLNVMEVLARRVLGIEHYVALEASVGFPDLLKSLAFIPEVFFLDIHIRPYNGQAMLQMIRADTRYNTSRIVALTASVMANEVDTLREAGFDSLIGKPINPQSFPKYLEMILEGEQIWSITWD